MNARQALGVELTTLSSTQLTELNLPEPLLDAVVEAGRITARGALRRQHQYIGSLMREVDIAPIVEQIQRWAGQHAAENARFRQLERLRDELLENDNSLAAFLDTHPQANSQQLRTLIRNHRREAAANKPGRSSRELFRMLREITAQTTEPPAVG